MTSENSVSFKVYLVTSCDKPEVRRFGIDKDVVSNFTYFSQKLQSVFPILKGKVFTVYWKDEDEDEVVISSDEELIIALTEMRSDIKRIHVSVSNNSQNSDEQELETDQGVIHYGITCDGCETLVQGFRYKCLQCEDYDLCTECEAKGFHSEHFMMRFPVPVSWRPGSRERRFANYMAYCATSSLSDNKCRKSKHDFNKSCHQEKGAKEKVTSENGQDHHNRKGKHDKRKEDCHQRTRRSRHGVFLESPMIEMLHKFASPFLDISNNNNNQQDSAQDGAKMEEDEDMYVRYLGNVGKTVANLLDPLGIDVDVQISTNKDKGKKKEQKDKESQPEEEAATPMQTDEPENATASAPPTENGDAEGWTILNKSKPSPSTSLNEDVQMVTNSSEAANARDDAAPGPSSANIYPTLNEVTNNATSFNSDLLHPDPKIARSLKLMMSMGFENQGGWLTTLLESKDGDIGRVLEVLQPHKE